MPSGVVDGVPWLAAVGALTGSMSLATATAHCCRALEQQPAIRLAGMYLLSPDKHSLAAMGWPSQAVSGAGSLSWQMDDFSQPFTRAIRQNKAFCMDLMQRVYWYDNLAFGQLSSELNEDEFLLIKPIVADGQGAHGVLVLIASSAQLADSDALQQFVQILAGQLVILTKLNQQQVQQQWLNKDVQTLKNRADDHDKSHRLEKQIIGDSDVMATLRKNISRASRLSLSVLIQGETGTGKDLIAQAIHQLSDRKDKPLVTINCAAIPENLLESELFGHEQGAFSGATKAKVGLVKEADGGSLFLDEIGDMPANLQAKLLRVLEAGKYRPVGATQEQNASFRLICATHVNLQQQVEQGLFRRDLFYRINQFPLLSPALRERLADLGQLCQHLIARYNLQHQGQVTGIRYSALTELRRYAFPGNVRELKNIIDYACAHTEAMAEISVEQLPLDSLIMDQVTQAQGVAGMPNIDTNAMSQVNDLKQAILDYEKHLITARLAEFDGDRARAADSLGLPKRTLAHKCLRLEIGN
ncbi:sigma-54 interaction domain-containing protein [Motilimonas sp. KMU-193]|uniref:sigma-54 interaction domain-containing protein n=1 Tax=Motilimonas sp. KMU-193 TaxID=3388668 RepID=UPI00396B393C